MLEGWSQAADLSLYRTAGVFDRVWWVTPIDEAEGWKLELVTVDDAEVLRTVICQSLDEARRVADEIDAEEAS